MSPCIAEVETIVVPFQSLSNPLKQGQWAPHAKKWLCYLERAARCPWRCWQKLLKNCRSFRSSTDLVHKVVPIQVVLGGTPTAANSTNPKCETTKEI